MKLHELTLEQQSFAEAHHNIIYAFLREKKLRPDDYYDVVVFGYLRAVQKYLLRAELRQYAFSTIAWRAMECDLGEHYQAQSRPMRRAVTVSLDAMHDRNNRLAVADVVPSQDNFFDRLEAELLWDEITQQLTPEQIEILRKRVLGYNNNEIAASQKRKRRDIESLFAEIQAIVLDFCMPERSVGCA